MNYITAENLTKSFGIRTLFEDISFNVNEGDKIAIVAKNGSGKSTLLKILMGQETMDSGTVVINKDIQVVLFDQEIDFEGEQSIEEFMMSLDSAPIVALKNYHHALVSGDPDDMDSALAGMEQHKAWDLENEMAQILSQLKITDLSAKMKNLSGGQIKRVALAKLLTETRAEHKHTLLIMDEPTNHLDVDMVEWLEQYLSKARITLLFSPPESLEIGEYCVWSSNRNKRKNCDAVIVLPFDSGKFSEISLIKSITRWSSLYFKPFCEKYPNFIVSPVSISPLSYFSKPWMIFSKVDFPAPFFPTIPTFSPR